MILFVPNNCYSIKNLITQVKEKKGADNQENIV